ncbi:tRNA (adenosine(37)-N6)-threonylcarbamoyltransferase complex dimerization subunit type 1 TsaB [Spirochaetia bacterium]|nr:tRNA (adenosine(37)-N6)-threonylcarbamoyltransferase complex dimerization subunit type 1 TsaB [Spirochaetia bacterium]
MDFQTKSSLSNKTILAIDTSGLCLHIALQTEAGVFLTLADAGTTHSELLLDAIDGLLKLARKTQDDLDLLAALKGPGSFTGLRIGFAAIKGIALALNKQMVSVPTLDCAAFIHRSYPGLVLPVLDAKQRKFFAAAYRSGERLTEYIDAAPQTLAALIEKNDRGGMPALLTGSGAELANNALAGFIAPDKVLVYPDYNYPLAGTMLKYIQDGSKIITGDDFFQAPLYIRLSDAEINAANSELTIIKSRN